jgi:hypothetical protein
LKVRPAAGIGSSPLFDLFSRPTYVLEDFFGGNLIAMTIPKEHPGRLAYISEFIEKAKASGLVQSAITHSGWRGVHVAPQGYPAAQK